jgi:hypothetical protein
MSTAGHAVLPFCPTNIETISAGWCDDSARINVAQVTAAIFGTLP